MMFNNLQRQLKTEISRQRRVLESKEEIIHGKIKFAWMPVRLSSGAWVWLSKYREHPAGYYINGRGAISRMLTPFMKVIEAYPIYRTANIGSVTFSDLENICDLRVPRGDVVRTINAVMSSINKTKGVIQELEGHLDRLKPSR
uniref:Uncharacterized protein n=1 Tax=Serratia phage Kevin TaxID=3161161 RepID=A0AAU8L0N9_9CAUD